MDYFYAKVEQVADDLGAARQQLDVDSESVESLKHPLRAQLARIMRDLASVLHDIEWSDSGDRLPDAWIPAARRFVDRFQEGDLRGIEKLLTTMSRAEKAQVLQWVTRDVGDSAPGIDSRPGVCGGEACIVRTRIPVWILEQERRLGTSESDLLKAYPTLCAEDLTNAWAYVRSHTKEIERGIIENEDA